MTDNGPSERINTINHKHNMHRLSRSIVPGSAINSLVASTSHKTTRSISGSTTANSRIQMDPCLQALLIAENQANEMIAAARAKRTKLTKQLNRECQKEIEAFRHECATRYKSKLNQATKMEEYEAKLDLKHRQSLKEIEEKVRKHRTSVINYIVHYVVDQIPVRLNSKVKYNIF